MTERIKAWLERLGDQFWLRPAIVVIACAAAALIAVELDRRGVGTGAGSVSAWLYGGGESGARALLGAIASSMIGVAGTIFSITVAALSLASGQMGPRLLRNFVRDAGNQIALGIFLGSFAYALLVLRTVRGTGEGAFVPHLGVTGSLVLALVCVFTLVWFVHHIAAGINVEKVVLVVHRDLCGAIERLTEPSSEGAAPPVAEPTWPGGRIVRTRQSGYVQAIDLDGLAADAETSGRRYRILVRTGTFVSPGLPVATVAGGGQAETSDEGSTEAVVARALVVGPAPAAVQDLEFSAHQLVEIAVRALSPGINDPFTAASVLDRLGDALCHLAGRRLPDGTRLLRGALVVSAPATDYAGLADTMFNTIRQNATASPFALIRLVDVLDRVAQVETEPGRRRELARHADLALAAARDGFGDTAALAEIEARHRRVMDRLSPDGPNENGRAKRPAV